MCSAAKFRTCQSFAAKGKPCSTPCFAPPALPTYFFFPGTRQKHKSHQLRPWCHHVTPSHHRLCCPFTLSSVHGADGCCPSTVFFHGGRGRGCCDVNPTNKLHPLLSTAGKAVPGQDASLAGAFSSEGHQSASSSHPFALPREISRSPALSCLGYKADTSTAFVPPPQSVSSSHSQTSFPSQ